MRIWHALAALLLSATVSPCSAAAGVDALSPETPWRVYLVCKQQDKHRKGPPTYTTAPPANWMQPDYDDSGWGRYGSDLPLAIGGYGFEQSPASARLYLRTRFGVTDPAVVRDLALTLEYRGGIIVHLNGQEVARQHLAAGPLEPDTLAEAYPDDVTGTPLERTSRPAEENLAAYEKRIRKLSVTLPARFLRKGANTLALELRAPPTDKMKYAGKGEWSAVGLSGFSLRSPGGAGIVPYAEAVKGVTIWNATPMDTIANVPGKYQSGFLWWGIAITPVGLTRGNPFEPLQPIRTVAPRGGTASGQVVVSGPGTVKGLRATISSLKHERSSATLPAANVQVRFGHQAKEEKYINALQRQPAEDAAVHPVWVLVDVPRDQAPGWYTGTLTIALGAQQTAVPVQVLVAAWTVPDPRDNATLISLYQSPDTLADHFQVEPWSDKHFALIEQSMTTMAKMGNDVLLVPVVIENYLNHKTGLIRWVKKATGYEPDFTAFERYYDLQTKVWGRPKIVTLSIWKHDFGTRSWFRGMKSDVVKPVFVTEFDPRTGKMSRRQAPHFGEPGSEPFWKPMIDGVRRIVKARGGDDRFVLLGEAFDSRPLEAHRLFFEKIAPGARWQIYSHFDGGEPPVKDGKFICHGGFEVGFRINPNGGSLPELRRDWPKVTPTEFLTAQAHRTDIHLASSPLSYRNVMRASGTMARIGMDFWPIGKDSRGRPSSYYGCPPNEGWLWRAHVPFLTAPSPDGAVITTRGQMLMECLQETELLIALIRAKQTASPEMVARIDRLLADRNTAGVVAGALSQATISLDWLGMAAREYAVAAELAGTRSAADWDKPPAVTGGAR
jgi:hypothetical protein